MCKQRRRRRQQRGRGIVKAYFRLISDPQLLIRTLDKGVAFYNKYKVNDRSIATMARLRRRRQNIRRRSTRRRRAGTLRGRRRSQKGGFLPALLGSLLPLLLGSLF